MKAGRRPYGSEEGRQERRDRFIRVVYGGGNKGDNARPTVGRLAKLQKAVAFLVRATRTEDYEFNSLQGATLLSAVEAEIEKLRDALKRNAKDH
jgi:hypothetical protein